MIREHNGKKIMTIDLNLDPQFVEAIETLINEYGEKFEIMNGFHNSNLNFSDFIDNFIDTKCVADVSIDSNANNATHDICTLENDMMKPHKKLLAYNKIFYELRKYYGLEEAEKWIRNEWLGAFYLHNSSTSSYKPYCFAYDLDQLGEKGLFFMQRFKTGDPKHLTTFNDHVLEFIGWACNRSSGAKH